MGKAFVGVLLLHQHITSQTQSLFTLLSDLCHSYKLQLGNQFAGRLSRDKRLRSQLMGFSMASSKAKISFH
ncbi:hypothetical protein F2Q70_00009328 [Brassica cretica]|uniref:Uncharacterized protein n=1 Tax=Brassica cretica TaxID=69181 RepID=A0A8S9M375_BRACR|nr:hypothetical protein F2Q70_00009328 [Brassica cretica]